MCILCIVCFFVILDLLTKNDYNYCIICISFSHRYPDTYIASVALTRANSWLLYFNMDVVLAMKIVGVKMPKLLVFAALELANAFENTLYTCKNTLGSKVRVCHSSWPPGLELSVIVPMDTNIEVETREEIVFETALMCDRALYYNAYFGYDDVRRFGSIAEVMDEVNRIHDMMQSSTSTKQACAAE